MQEAENQEQSVAELVPEPVLTCSRPREPLIRVESPQREDDSDEDQRVY